MSDLSPKERLWRVLEKKTVDRPPVLCTGGMMNAAVVGVLERTGPLLPAAHHDEGRMADLALAVRQDTGFENLGIPFCLTVEAEVLGSEIDFGTLACEPKIAREVFPSVRQVRFRDIGVLEKSGRIATVVQAGYRLSRQEPDWPVIANLTGPISTAASIVDPMTFLKELRKDPENAHRVLDYVSDFLIAYARLLIEGGATVIAIGDPTATGEILGPKVFAEYAVPYLNKIVAAVHDAGRPAIVHICGDIKAVRHLAAQLRSDALSTDALVNLRALKEEYPALTTMGNLSTYLLQSGSPASVAAQTLRLVRDGIDIISPACGLSTSSSLAAIQAMTATVKESRRDG
ncbi:MAG: methylcobamide--CoM methyltransferase [Deltaproteobacteria bacterium]|nr:methylcobamide--CoM methyltransferase [Deltaproteobacteria bacterium]